MIAAIDAGHPMMRLARRATLLVAFFLLTSAATAYAECAWVLWVETTGMDAKPGGAGYSKAWEVGAAASSADRCSQLRAANARDRAARLQETYKEKMKSDADSVTVFTGHGFTTDRYVCLPDSVDPRGPKTK